MNYTRRRVLIVSGATFAVAGCTGGGESGAENGDGTEPEDGNTEFEEGTGTEVESGNTETEVDDHGDGGTHHGTEALDDPEPNAEVAMVSEDGHHFEPHLVWIETGGTVTWTTESGVHTTTAYHSDADKPNRVPDGADGWDSGLLEAGETFERTFEEDGVYDYFCKPHESAMMVGSVIVGEPDPHEQPGLEPPQEELPDGAREMLEKLNDAANETLGHTHD